jgi:hypothetical protein
MRQFLGILGLLVCLGCDSKDEGTETLGDGGESESGTETGDGGVECQNPDPIPGECECVAPGQPCAQGCFFPDGTRTCSTICASVGETCVENGCDGWTYITGVPGTCPVTENEVGVTVSFGCDELIPSIDGMTTPEQEVTGAKCCCTQSD